MTKKWKIKLYPISPIHIGDGEICDPTDYIAKEGYVYYLNQTEFIPYLLEKGNNLLKDALDKTDLIKITQVLADKFDPEIKEHWNSRTKVDTNFYNLWKRNLVRTENSQQLHRFIRNRSNSQPYIPGSSLKGAIRTAILDVLNEDDKLQKIKQLKIDKFRPQNAEAILLNARNQKGFFDISADPFKGFKVSDAVLSDEMLFLDTIKREGMSEKDLPVYYEMLKPKSEDIEFKITASQEFMRIVIDVINRLNVFYKKLINQELQWLQEHLNSETAEYRKKLVSYGNSAITNEGKCLIRLGFGSGHWSMTLHDFWKENLKTKALWHDQLLGWALLEFSEI